MAYQINYYRNRAMTHAAPDSDQIGDAAFARYPAPTGTETAFARHTENRELARYGYDGGWHKLPPRERVEADRRDGYPTDQY